MNILRIRLGQNINNSAVNEKSKIKYPNVYIFKYKLLLCSTCDKYDSNSDKIFQEEESIKTLRFFGSVANVNE